MVTYRGWAKSNAVKDRYMMAPSFKLEFQSGSRGSLSPQGQLAATVKHSYILEIHYADGLATLLP